LDHEALVVLRPVDKGGGLRAELRDRGDGLDPFRDEHGCGGGWWERREAAGDVVAPRGQARGRCPYGTTLQRHVARGYTYPSHSAVAAGRESPHRKRSKGFATFAGWSTRISLCRPTGDTDSPATRRRRFEDRGGQCYGLTDRPSRTTARAPGPTSRGRALVFHAGVVPAGSGQTLPLTHSYGRRVEAMQYNPKVRPSASTIINPITLTLVGE